MKPHVLVARLDSMGDVLLAGPAVRAVAAGARRVTMLVSPVGRAAAAMLPGANDLCVWQAPWIDANPEPVARRDMLRAVKLFARVSADQAIILTSFHQSPLPLALLLRMAGIMTIAAVSEDYPGSLLDIRHRVSDEIHEVERALSLVGTLGYRLPPEDDGRLRVIRSPAGSPASVVFPRYVVVHPGASVPARAWDPARYRELVGALVDDGHCVIVTGAVQEQELTGAVAGLRSGQVQNAGGVFNLPELAEVLARADVVITGNTGPAHLAAAVGTPVVSLYAPTVPAVRWRPWGVVHELLGEQDIACAGCRARRCPQPGHPCLSCVTIDDVRLAVARLQASDPRRSRVVAAVP